MLHRFIFAPRTRLQHAIRKIVLQLLPRGWRLRDPRDGTASTALWITTLGSAFWASRVLMSAVELGVFDYLAKGKRTLSEIAAALRLHPRSAADFLDALTALALLEKHNGRYANTTDGKTYLISESPLYIGSVIRMTDERLYGFWGNLTTALQTGLAQNELKDGYDQFAAIYANPERVRLFASSMSAVSMAPAYALSSCFPWLDYRTVADIGGAEGVIPIVLAREHRHLTTTCMDLPQLAPLFDELSARLSSPRSAKFVGGDIFRDPWPRANIVVLGHMLHNFDLERRTWLLRRAYDSIEPPGAVIVYDAMIDDERTKHVIGLLMSLNMLIETPAGSDYTFAEITHLLEAAGFEKIRVEHLAGFDWVAFGFKMG